MNNRTKSILIALVSAIIIFIVSSSIFGSIFNFTFVDAIKSTTIMSIVGLITILSSILIYIEMEDYYYQLN